MVMGRIGAFLNPETEATPERKFEATLRPDTLNGIVGQQLAKDGLRIFIAASKLRDRPLDHVFLAGPPGLGKTTFAKAIAHEMALPFIEINALAVDYELLDWFVHNRMAVEETVFFVDEIHAVDKKVFTAFYALIEDFRWGEEQVRPFTLIGATTDPNRVPQPMRDRFGIQYRLDFYATEELATLVARSFSILLPNAKISNASCVTLGERSRGTPRVTNQLLKRCIDFAAVDAGGDDLITALDESVVKRTMELLRIDKQGLTDMDRAVLRVMLERFENRPVGIAAVATSIGEDTKVVEVTIEPWLVRGGFINRESRGRKLTPKGVLVAAKVMEDQIEW